MLVSDLNYTLVLINYSAFEIWERYAVFQEQSTMTEIIQDSPCRRLLEPLTSLGTNDSRTLLPCVDNKAFKGTQTWSAPILFPVWLENLNDGWAFEVVDINSKLADYTCAKSKFYFDSQHIHQHVMKRV